MNFVEHCALVEDLERICSEHIKTGDVHEMNPDGLNSVTEHVSFVAIGGPTTDVCPH